MMPTRSVTAKYTTPPFAKCYPTHDCGFYIHNIPRRQSPTATQAHCAANLIKQKARSPIMHKLLMPFFLIYILSGCHFDRAAQTSSASQHNIARPAIINVIPKPAMRKKLFRFKKRLSRPIPHIIIDRSNLA